ncbi:MAG: MBL fold metallo-hydrolase, partial [Gammaproteobacteria bacterium]|nr:MBL fold metallo-hydrolase [Gammaproteobacteria bacterium]
NNRRPTQKLPEDHSSLKLLETKTDNVRFIWFGHSTILLEIDSKRIVIDPIFSNYSSPIPGIVKRFQPPVFDIDEIENIDIVLISHDHYDHLDHETIKKLKDRDIQYIVPLGVGAHLRYWGINKSRIIELDWWEETVVQNLKFTATPAQHFSGRALFNGNSTLWASWAVQGKEQNIYFGGDSGYSEHYKEIGDRLGPFDLTFLENGAYNLDWKFVHQLPEEGVQASIDLKSRAMIPIHWGMFDLAEHSWYDPIQRATKEANIKGVRIIAPKLGQLISTMHEYRQEAWWEPLIR